MSTLQVNPKDKIALVSGANRGIGKAITIELLNRGAKKVYAGARDISTLNELKDIYGEKIVPLALDVTDISSITSATQGINELDILVNNAGVFSIGGIFNGATNESLKQNLDVNVWGIINLSNAVIDALKKSKNSAIINISSLAGLGNMPMCATYSVSKAAVHSLTQGMRAELAANNTLVIGVYPGPIDTDMAANIEMDKDSPENVAKSIVVGLVNGNEDVFPDQLSDQIAPLYSSAPKEVEKQFSQFA